jgi:hypothetical protein
VIGLRPIGDGDALARLHRAGELTAIYIPTPMMKPCEIWSAPAKRQSA